MYEGFLLIALVVLVVLAIRPGKTDPIVIHKPGYHATLAPQLGRAEGFIELIFREVSTDGDIATQYFEVHDSAGKFLLAAGLRGGVLYFQAILPPFNKASGQAIRYFSDQVLVNIPLSSKQQDAVCLRKAVEKAAVQLEMCCNNLSSNDE
jgi:hypothetical protein